VGGHVGTAGQAFDISRALVWRGYKRGKAQNKGAGPGEMAAPSRSSSMILRTKLYRSGKPDCRRGLTFRIGDGGCPKKGGHEDAWRAPRGDRVGEAGWPLWR